MQITTPTAVVYSSFITLIDTDGDKHDFDRAMIYGIVDGHVVIQQQTEDNPNNRATIALPLSVVSQLTVDNMDDGCDTYEVLDMAGYYDDETGKVIKNSLTPA